MLRNSGNFTYFSRKSVTSTSDLTVIAFAAERHYLNWWKAQSRLTSGERPRPLNTGGSNSHGTDFRC